MKKKLFIYFLYQRMIGFFDSGVGGVQVMKEFIEDFDEYDMILLSDQKNVPYGNKTPQQIQNFTFEALHRLFANGAKIVILACNTASCYAIRKRQSEHPNQKVLSVTIPGIEKVKSKNFKKVGVISTKATYNSGFYDDLLDKHIGKKNYQLSQSYSSDLVDFIEDGKFSDNFLAENMIKNIKKNFPDDIECLVLGCTHYPIMESFFQKEFDCEIINPGLEAKIQFQKYLKNHPETSQSLTKNKKKLLVTTGDLEAFRVGVEKILGGLNNTNEIFISHSML